MDAGCTPTRILAAHLPDQISGLAGDNGSSGLPAPNLPRVLRQNVVLDKRIVFYLGSPLRFGIAGGFDGWWKLHAGKGSEKGLCLGYDTGKE